MKKDCKFAEDKLKTASEGLSRAKSEIQKAQMKKQQYASECARFEKSLLQFASDLHIIEERMRLFDTLCGEKRKMLHKEWRSYDTERDKYDHVRYSEALRRICGKAKTNKIRKDAHTQEWNFEKYTKLPEPSSKAKEFVFKTRFTVVPTTVERTQITSKPVTRSSVKRKSRKRGISPEIKTGKVADPRLRKRVKPTIPPKKEVSSQRIPKRKKKKKKKKIKVLTQPPKGKWV